MQRNKIPVQIHFILSLLGCWLFASTLSFGSTTAPLLYSNIIVSFLLIFLGLKCRKHSSAFEIWCIALLGIWLQMSPLLFWAPTAASYINDTFVGSWVIALAVILHPMPGHTFEEKATIPPGWSYNPSAWTQRLPIALLAFACWMIARYLSAYQLGYIDTIWDPLFTPGTKAVLESNVSKLFPVSDAGLGALAYTLEFFSTIQGGANRWRTAPWLVLIFGILVIPVSLVSTILIILQPLAVGTWCTLCLITAILMLVGIPLAIGEVAASIQFLRHSKEKPFFTLLLKGGSCRGETVDTLSPPMDAPILTLFKSSLSGLTFPWNLSLCIPLGVFLMAAPSFLSWKGLLYNADPILGALTIIISTLAYAEYARSWRFANLGVALGVAWVGCNGNTPKEILLHVGAAIAIALLTIRKGAIREKFTFPKASSFRH